jgi:hypothetical protein
VRADVTADGVRAETAAGLHASVHLAGKKASCCAGTGEGPDHPQR